MSRGDQAYPGMTDRRPYTYVLLRYRHDPLAGEFANVGVLMHEPRSGYLDAKVRTTLGPRLTKMFPTLDGDAFKGSLQSVARSVRKLGSREAGDMLASLGDAASFARRVLPTDDSSFIWGPLGSGITDDPHRALEKLYARFVTQYDGKAKPSRDDAAVWRPVRDLLLARNIADRLQPKLIRSAVDQVEFDHAWKNGAWHCYQPLSFDLSSNENIREKAARWAGHMLALEKADEPFKPHFVVGAPTNPQFQNAYERAVALLRLSPGAPEVIEESATVGLVDKIEDELRAHDSALRA
jgi:hypothetical protein